MAYPRTTDTPGYPSAPFITWHSLRFDALLILVTLIWGGTFLVIQETVRLSGPFTFLALRFSFAALTLLLVFRRRLAHLTRGELHAGALIGLCLFAGFALQTLGLQYTISSKAAFITGLYVPLVPVFAILILRQWPTAGALLGVGLSFTGLTLLSVDETFNLWLGPGELLVIGCAVAIALHVVTVSRFAPDADAINLATVQIATAALLSLLAMGLAGEAFALPPLPVLGSGLFMGTVATAFCLAVMNRAQQFLSSTRAVLIYALEPVWAGIFGYLVGERLGVAALVGCGLILLGMVVSETLQARRAEHSTG